MSGSQPRSPTAYFISDRALLIVTILAVLVGSWLRMGWPLEIEYKADERQMFEWSQRVGTTAPWPALGMASGAGSLPNPGLSVWIFAGLAKLTGATTPQSLARVVQLLNCFSLVALTWFALGFADFGRRVWLWAVNLAALSPPGILLERKIWAQSLLPLLCVLMLMAWWRRKTFIGALLWSVLAMIAGQIHMTGFFFLGALLGWTLLFWRSSMHWIGCGVGLLLGSITAWPWLYALAGEITHSHGEGLKWVHAFGPQFWGLWFTDGLGVGIVHSFGTDYWTLLGYPVLAGHASYLVGAAEIGLCVILAVLLRHAAVGFWQTSSNWRGRFAALTSNTSESAFLCGTALLAYGVLLSLPDVTLQQHYLLIVFPLPYLWLAAAALSPQSQRKAFHEKLLVVALVLNVFITLQIFSFLRTNGGAPGGDFGVSLRAQINAAPTP